MLTALLKTWQTNDVFVTFGSVFHVADPLGEFVRVRSGYVILCIRIYHIIYYIRICLYVYIRIYTVRGTNIIPFQGCWEENCPLP